MGCSCCGHKYTPPSGAGTTPPQRGVIIVGGRRRISIPKTPPAPTVSQPLPTSEEKK